MLPELFSDRPKRVEKDRDEHEAELHRQIGQLKVELDWFKKNTVTPLEEKRGLVEAENPMLAISRQGELLALARSSYYYSSQGDDNYNLLLMNLIDEQFTRTPFYGVQKMTARLRAKGHPVNPKRVRRLRRLIGIEAIYPQQRTSLSGSEHKVYPYLLKGVTVDHPDQVWCADITSIRLFHGFVYLMVVMDWHSRYILSWELSITLEKEFWVKALREALWLRKPEIFNSDQGAQFTSDEFTGLLEAAGIRISMDGRERLFLGSGCGGQ